MDETLASPTTPEGICRRYDTSVIVRRWGATWMDFLLLYLAFFGLLFLAPGKPSSVPLLILPIGFAYFLILEHTFGRTLGKLICRVRIVNASGSFPKLSQAMIRTLFRILEVNPALLGGVPAGIVVLASKKRQRLGDMVAKTFVLREEDYRYLQHLHVSQTSGLGGAGPVEGFPPSLPTLLPPSVAPSEWVVPSKLSYWCVGAGYLGLVSVLLLPAPAALFAGVMGLRETRRNPDRKGKGRAWFGIVMGTLFSIVLLIGIGLVITDSRKTGS